MKVFITGGAGFIGYHLIRLLARGGHEVSFVDNMNDYYSVDLKKARLRRLEALSGVAFRKLDICDHAELLTCFEETRPDVVVHLAAQAGVRHSLVDPWSYVSSNVQGFLSVLECCRSIPVSHLLYASSSSVYGNDAVVPFTETERSDKPVSLYAATKRSGELIAHSYSQLFGIPMTGLRFFTVYGSWGRPDMAYFSFAERILAGASIEVFNNGHLRRDFTHVSDIVSALEKLLTCPPREDPAHTILNIGRGGPTPLLDFIRALEIHLGKRAVIEYKGMQLGDVYETYADTGKLTSLIDWTPQVDLSSGLLEFVSWFREWRLT